MKEKIYESWISPLLETNHVFNECDYVAKDITLNIKNILDRINKLDDLQSYITNNGYIYSGYNVNPNYVKKLKNNPTTVAFEKLNDIHKYNPIYYSLIYITENIVYIHKEHKNKFNVTDNLMKGSSNRRIIKTDAIDLIKSTDKIEITINIAKFIDDKFNIDYISILSTISHELQHIFDQFVIPTKDFTKALKNNPFYEFKDNNIFNINEKTLDYKIISAILYYTTHVEQRGFLSEFRTFLKKIIIDNKLKKKLFIDNLYNTYDVNGYPISNKNYELTEEHLLNHVYNTTQVQIISKINDFNLAIKYLNNLRVNNKKNIFVYFINIGLLFF